jgi:uncharacterized NAD(P)/FAD-binding protein YdhS
MPNEPQSELKQEPKEATPTREPNIYEQPIGRYGTEWRAFMKEEYPEIVQYLVYKKKFLTLCRQVNKEANAFRSAWLESYDKENPSPSGFWERIKWLETREFLVHGETMREVVLFSRNIDNE